MNKKVYRVGKKNEDSHKGSTEFDVTNKDITPMGGFPHYGVVNEDFLMIKVMQLITGMCCNDPCYWVIAQGILRHALWVANQDFLMINLMLLKHRHVLEYCVVKAQNQDLFKALYLMCQSDTASDKGHAVSL